jgi:hypothetical protein
MLRVQVQVEKGYFDKLLGSPKATIKVGAVCTDAFVNGRRSMQASECCSTDRLERQGSEVHASKRQDQI